MAFGSADPGQGIRQRSYASLFQINVTPLVDIVLVLLIIFMITAPMMSAAVEVDLPVTGAATPQAEDRLIVSVTKGQKLYIGDQLVLFPLLPERLRAVRGNSGKAVALRADKSLDYGFVLLVIDAIRRAGIENVGLVVNPLDLEARGVVDEGAAGRSKK